MHEIVISRYDGWEQSLESAAANIAEGEGELRRRNRSMGSVASSVVTQRRREQLKEGFKSVNTCLLLRHKLAEAVQFRIGSYL